MESSSITFQCINRVERFRKVINQLQMIDCSNYEVVRKLVTIEHDMHNREIILT